MTDLDTIIRPLLPELQRFEQGLMGQLSSDVAPLDAILRYVAEVKGKRLRPSLVLLSAHLFGTPNETTFRTAWFVELIHTATLIHDDVVDGTAARRGRAAVHVRWDAPTAVLAGDYLLGKAIHLLANADDTPILAEMLNTATAMSEGELMQLKKRIDEKTKNGTGDLPKVGDLTAEEYLEVVTRKTALLFRSCCVGGALSMKAPHEAVASLAEFGLHLGRVFQLRDDLLDNDDPETTRLASSLIGDEVTQTMEAFRVLEASMKGRERKETLEALKALAMFCAERFH